ncbi:uncharacterized protein MELLADRAFT_101917 [Melampsora larici-populina 98AG31]|uniref:C2H2-type domain-containing protein n=1 Tax=Melampsora larici-populina (strain 98AG31 / pathotype 3-4-7) TaxID=747676 RepID=F4R5C5_MELLP|nr:uncharacterized protein MELLADRAFT_101917 [Melampsora larici-populina 98AG31]EGG12285.1 hypothetical protein MELLADRAFT_101917 [Melampsora larici-populina 98AG31]
MQNHCSTSDYNDPQGFYREDFTLPHTRSQDRTTSQPFEEKNVLTTHNFAYLGERPLVNTIPVYPPFLTSRRRTSSVSSDDQSVFLDFSSVPDISLSAPISSKELAQFWSFMGDTTMPLFESLPIISEGSALALQDLEQGQLGISSQSPFYDKPGASSEATGVPSYHNHSVSKNPHSILIGPPSAPHRLDTGPVDIADAWSLAKFEGASTSNTIKRKRSRLSSEDTSVTNESEPDFIQENGPKRARVAVTETPNNKNIYICSHCRYETERLDNFQRHLRKHLSKPFFPPGNKMIELIRLLVAFSRVRQMYKYRMPPWETRKGFQVETIFESSPGEMQVPKIGVSDTARYSTFDPYSKY